MTASVFQIKKSLVWSFLEQAGAKIIQLVVQIILARILAPDAFGVLAILLVVTQIVDSIAQSGLGTALIQKEDATATSYSTAWWLSLGFSAMLYAVLFLVAPTIASFFSMDGLDAFLRVIGLIVFFNAANSIQRSFLQRTMDFCSIFRASTIAALLSGAVGIGLAVLGGGVWALVAQSLAQSVFICFVMWVQVSWKPTFEFDRKQAKELFSYGWKICVTGVLNVFYQGVSELILGRTTSAGALGLYSQGRKYPVAAIGVMSNAIANVLFPSFSEVKSDPDELRLRIRKALSFGTFVVAAVSFWLAVIAEPVMLILLTEKWADCIPIFQLTCISNSVLMLQLVNLRAYMALGDSGLYMRLQIVKVLGGGFCIWVTAALSHSIYATAVATFVVGVLSVLCVDMPPARRMHGYGALTQLQDQLPIFFLAIAASAAGVVAGLLLSNEWAKLLVQTIVFAFVYLGGAKLFHFEQLPKLIATARGMFGGHA